MVAYRQRLLFVRRGGGGRFTDRRCRGRRPRRPAEVSGGGRYTGGMNPSPTDIPLTAVSWEVAEGSRPLPTMRKINGRQWQGCGRACPAPTDCHKWVTDGRGEGGRQPGPSQWTGGCPLTGYDTRPVKAPQASQARPAPHCVGRLLRGRSPREKPPHQGRWPRSRPEGFAGLRVVAR